MLAHLIIMQCSAEQPRDLWQLCGCNPTRIIHLNSVTDQAHHPMSRAFPNGSGLPGQWHCTECENEVKIRICQSGRLHVIG